MGQQTQSSEHPGAPQEPTSTAFQHPRRLSPRQGDESLRQLQTIFCNCQRQNSHPGPKVQTVSTSPRSGTELILHWYALCETVPSIAKTTKTKMLNLHYCSYMRLNLTIFLPCSYSPVACDGVRLWLFIRRSIIIMPLSLEKWGQNLGGPDP